ncbi:MAG: MDR family MFS transporter [Dehalococcoidia bacterium]
MSDEFRPPVQLSHRQIQIVFLGLMAGMLLSSLDQTVVATALPTIVGELGGLEHLSWVITAYLLSSTASMPLYGKLSDMYGRKLLFQAAIVVFLIGSLLSGISQNMTELVTCRGIQGLGAGGIMILSQTIVGDIIAPRDRGRYQGYMGSIFAVSAVAGPLIGGFFTDNLTWRWVFYVNIPVGIMALLVTAVVLRMPVRRVKQRIDYSGALLMVSGLVALLLLTSWGGIEYPWLSPMIIGLGVVGIVLLGFFVLNERRVSEPLVPLRLFRNKIFAVATLLSFIVGIGFLGSVSYLPIYFQVVRGTSATMSGLAMLPLMATVFLGAVGSGWIISKIGRYRMFPISGTGIMIVGTYLLSRMNDGTPWLRAALFMAVLGIGLGMVMQVPILAVQNAVAHKDLGTGTASVNLFRSLGSAFGVAIFGAILSNRLTSELRQILPPQTLGQINPTMLTASPAQLKTLPAAVHAGVVHAFSLSLNSVFLWAVPMMVVAFLVAWLLQDIPLREYAHVGKEEAPPPLEGEAAAD